MATSLPACMAFTHLPSSQAGAQLAIGPGGFQAVTNHFSALLQWDAGLATRILRFYTGATHVANFDVPSVNQLTHGFRFKVNTVYSNMVVYYTGVSSVLSVGINASGKLQVRRGSTVLATGATTVTDNVWRYLEIKVVFANGTDGSVHIKLNGADEIPLTGSLDTRNADGAITAVQFTTNNQGTSGSEYQMCDFYFADDMEFWGPCSIKILRPNSNVAVQWTPDSGDNYARVEDASGCDSATSYVDSTTVGHVDEYGVPDHALTLSHIRAVMAVAIGAAPEGGSHPVKPFVKLSGTVAGASQNLSSTAYQMLASCLKERPGGGSWTLTDLNAASVGIEAT
jgi:hypothetical protein